MSPFPKELLNEGGIFFIKENVGISIRNVPTEKMREAEGSVSWSARYWRRVSHSKRLLHRTAPQHRRFDFSCPVNQTKDAP
jgi:hypothetical protein